MLARHRLADDRGALVLLALLVLSFASCSNDSGSDPDADFADLAYRHPIDVIAADLDGDGLVDLAIALHDFTGNASLDVLRNTTAGGAPIASFAPDQHFGLPAFPMAIAPGFLDNDARPDLVTGNADPNQLTFKFNDVAHPGFFPTSVQETITPQPAWLAVGDFDSDGRSDVAVAMNDASAPGILFQDPVQPGIYLPIVPLPPDALGNVVSAGDFDGDALDDIVLGSLVTPSLGVVVCLQDPANPGDFLTPVVTATTTPPERLLLADLDDDGALDVAVSGHTGLVEWLYQDPATGMFVPPVSLAIAAGGTFQESLAAGDLDGDGGTDLVVVTNDTGVLDPDKSPPVLSLNTKVSVLRQDPANPRAYLPADSYPLNEDTSSVAIADLNDDGHPDLVTVGHNPQITSFTILFQDPAQPGLFLAPVVYQLH